MNNWRARLTNKIEWVGGEPSPHLIWTGAKNRFGYPYMRNEKGQTELVSRILWRKSHLKNPVRLKNTCGRRDCVAPGHHREQ